MTFILLLLNKKVQRWEGVLMKWNGSGAKNTVLTKLMKGWLNITGNGTLGVQNWEVISESRENKEKGEKKRWNLRK